MDKTFNERLAWLAGILDGEGYVSVQETRTFRRARGYTERSLQFQIRIGNTDLAMINEMRSILDTMGIGFHLGSSKSKNPKHKLCFYLIVHGRPRVERLLRAVVSWLITKRPHAELILAIAERRQGLGVRGKPLADAVLTAQLRMMRVFNRRGVHMASDKDRPQNSSQESASPEVVGAEGDETIPTASLRNQRR